MPLSVAVGVHSAWEHACGTSCGCKYHTFDELQLGDSSARKVHVLLPAGYSSCSLAYPVLYMNDGNAVMFDGEAGEGSPSLRMHDAVHAAAEGAASSYTGLLADYIKIIVVSVEPLDRDAEYTHIELPGGGGGGLADYTVYLSDLLIPFIDAHYRTVAHSRGRAIGGYSHGGLAAFLAACRHPHTFGAALCFSPSLWLGMDSTGDENDLLADSRVGTVRGDGGGTGGLLAFCHMEESKLYEDCKAVLGSHRESIKRNGHVWPFANRGDSVMYHRPRFYIDWGLLRVGGMHNMLTEAMVTKRGTEMVGLLVNEHGYLIQGRVAGALSELMVVEDPHGGHDMLAWRYRLPRALKWLFTGINDVVP